MTDESKKEAEGGCTDDMQVCGDWLETESTEDLLDVEYSSVNKVSESGG